MLLWINDAGYCSILLRPSLEDFAARVDDLPLHERPLLGEHAEQPLRLRHEVDHGLCEVAELLVPVEVRPK